MWLGVGGRFGNKSHALQDKAPGGSRKRGAPEAEEDDLPDDVRQRLSAIKGADLG